MRDRLLMPLFIPVGAAAAIFLLIFSVGKILLEVDPQYSTAIAIIGATSILGVCTLLAIGPRLNAAAIYTTTALPASIIIAIGLYIAVRPTSGEGHGGEGAGAAAVTSITQVTTDNAFSVTAVTVPVGAEVTLTLDNKGAALHNWHLTVEGKEIKTELVAAGKSETLKFTVEKAGVYDFLCDVHPKEMKGKLTAVEGAAATAGETGGGGNTIVETDNKFDKGAFTVKANEQVTFTVENKGSAIHNWHVLVVKDKSGNDIMTKLSGGGTKETITFIIDKPGTYDYQCDVHPTEMRGKLTVQ
jgi:plastocyanin